MMVSDPISDTLIRIKNASTMYHKSLLIPYSNVSRSILNIMKNEGYVGNVEEQEVDGKKMLRIYLKYGNKREKFILGIKRISKPGRRIYVGKDRIPRVLDGFGTAVISTPKGLMTDREARKEGQGGEVICFIW
ncbi:MAG: 30S ribosomal protein S8 [Caldisericaceae bacterium]|nr:30S ribosomal protein S8 [Caldisericaceae bacterium]